MRQQQYNSVPAARRPSHHCPFTGGFFIVLLASWLAGCSPPGSQADRQDEARPPAAGAQTALHYARGFSIRTHAAYTLVSIFAPGAGLHDTLRYLLYPRGAEPPADYPHAVRIATPIRRLVGLSTSHLALADALGLDSLIVGIQNPAYIYNPALLARVAAGKTQAVGSEGTLNLERVLALGPDLVMVTAFSAADNAGYDRLKTARIPVLFNLEWRENTPLGRAEWLKLMGLLTGRTHQADSLFAVIETNYNAVAAQALTAKTKPSVILGESFRDAWYVPGGKSFMAKFLQDAGAGYHWAPDTNSGSLMLNFEAIYPIALQADYWLDPGAAKSLNELLAVDTRQHAFSACRTHHVYNCNRRLSPAGGNDYWESAVVRPDLVLHDLVNILHPGLLSDTALVYHRQLN